MRTSLNLLAILTLAASSVLAGEPHDRNPNTPEGWSRYSDEPPIHLDDTLRARDEKRAHFLYASLEQIATLRRKYDPKTFDIWRDKLKAIRSGMTVDEIKSALSARTAEATVSFGSGVIVCFELDDTYFLHGLFDGESRLLGEITKPIAITYFTSLRRTVSPAPEGTIEHLGLPK